MAYIRARHSIPRHEKRIPMQTLAAFFPGIECFSHHSLERSSVPLPSHCHSDRIEIIVFRKGVQPIFLGKHCYVLSGGDILIIPPCQVHSTARNPQYSADYLRIQVKCVDLTSLLGLDAAATDTLLSRLNGLCSFHYRHTGTLCKQASSAFEHALSNQSCERMQAQGELLCFLYSLENQLRVEAISRTPAINIAVRYINDHITEDISIHDLAKMCKFSLSYFKECFLREVGVSPMYYINWRRIAYAKRMIALGYSVTDVSMLLNFNSSSYFSTVFKNFTTRTPLEYRADVEREMARPHHLANQFPHYTFHTKQKNGNSSRAGARSASAEATAGRNAPNPATDE